MEISVVIPAYNEVAVIVKTIDSVKKFLASNFATFEIIVVDDHSKDATVDIVKSQAGVRLIRNLKNHGKGYTVAKGVAAARGDWILFMDADSSTDISELSKFLPQRREDTLLIGSRGLEDSEVKVQQSSLKVFLGKSGNRLIRFLIAPQITDTQCGFKFFPKQMHFLFSKLTIATWGFDFELLWLARKYHFKIKEVPVTWVNDFDSKVRWYSYPQTLWQVFKVRLNDYLGKYN